MTAAFSKFNQHSKILRSSWIDTKLGSMMAIGDEEALYLLEFFDKWSLEREVEKLKIKTNSTIIPGSTTPIQYITHELMSYFEGKLKDFKTPLHFLGSSFQKLVWEELMRVPYGQTRSYREQAIFIGKDRAYRAVAHANGVNHLAIVTPCHRIIKSNGDFGGYSGGITRKKWLLEHEARHV